MKPDPDTHTVEILYLRFSQTSDFSAICSLLAATVDIFLRAFICLTLLIDIMANDISPLQINRKKEKLSTVCHTCTS